MKNAPRTPIATAVSGWPVGLLAVALFVLKVTGLIVWSWIWVLAPVWICSVLMMLVFAVLFLFEKDPAVDEEDEE